MSIKHKCYYLSPEKYEIQREKMERNTSKRISAYKLIVDKYAKSIYMGTRCIQCKNSWERHQIHQYAKTCGLITVSIQTSDERWTSIYKDYLPLTRGNSYRKEKIKLIQLIKPQIIFTILKSDRILFIPDDIIHIIITFLIV